MNKVDKQALRSVAENATPGEWCTDVHHGVIADAGLNANYYIASCSGPEHRANTRYIAAANPATMLALLDENEALEKRVAELAAENADLKHPGTYLPSKIDTPATDAFINEMRAKGVEMLAAEYESKIEPYKNHDEFMNAHYLKMQANEARNFAQKLREAKS
ncbi:ead/Ea22-like family protein [Edwardsiella tarda]